MLSDESSIAIVGLGVIGRVLALLLLREYPLIKIDKWTDAKPMLKGWGKDQIKQKKEEIKIWWNNYKNKLQESMGRCLR